MLFFAYINPYVFHAMHWGFGISLLFVVYPARKNSSKNMPSIIDFAFIVATIYVVATVVINKDELLFRIMMQTTTNYDFLAGLLAAIICFEAARRSIGLSLPIIATVFFLYTWKGNIIPGYLGTRGFSLDRIFGFFLSDAGIFGTAMRTSSEYLYLMILFGAFLHISGAGEFFIRLAMSLTGHQRGGPAKVAVVASALFGTVSGSSVSNVIGTGSFTIPLMKRIGYKKHFAGAVEAVASTGGQIMPPVMGTGAFLMVELAGVPYRTVMLTAALPALLYYFSLFLSVDFEAQKNNLKGVPKEELEPVSQVLKNGIHLLLPLITLLYTLGIGRWTIKRAAIAAILSCIIISWGKKETRMGIKKILEAMHLGSIRSLTIVSVVGCAGIVISCILLTGLGNKFTFLVTQLAGNNELLALIFAAFCALILGMGLPTLASYMIVASVLTASLMQLGFENLPINMFLFYFACLSNITPPVAMASYAAANVANSEPNLVGWTAVKLGLIAFIIPFIFIYNKTLLLIGDWQSVVIAFITSIIGVYFFGIALNGWHKGGKISLLLRVISMIVSILLIIPGIKSDIVGLFFTIIFFALHKNLRKYILQFFNNINLVKRSKKN
jgi:TRAP transporter 4TM/12TM fusion protein